MELSGNHNRRNKICSTTILLKLNVELKKSENSKYGYLQDANPIIGESSDTYSISQGNPFVNSQNQESTSDVRSDISSIDNEKLGKTIMQMSGADDIILSTIDYGKKSENEGTRKAATHIEDIYFSGKMPSTTKLGALTKQVMREGHNVFEGLETERDEKYSYSGSGYDYSKSFAEQIDDWKNNKIPQNDSLIVGGTPKLYQDIGFNAVPVTINQTHVDYAINGTKDIDHHLGETLLKQLPQAMENPVAIIKSQTNPGRTVSILKMVHNGNSVVVPIEIDGVGTQNNIRIDSNAIASIFGKSNAITKLLADALNDEVNGNTSMFYWNKKEALSLLQRPGLQLPNRLPQDGFIHSITEKGSTVKRKFNNVTETQQFKRWFGDWQKNPKKASKIVNADGTPKIMYHGTSTENGEFFVFDYSKAKKRPGLGFKALGKGNYFTSKDLSDNSRYDRILAVYLDIKKPYVAEKPLQEICKELGVSNQNEIQEALQSLGYDGIIQYNKNGEISIAVTFESNQIKSATDNIGTFDRDNTDIRYAMSDRNGTNYKPLSDGIKGKIESVFGVRVVVDDTIPITDKSGNIIGEADGYYKDGVVHLSKNAKNPLQFVLAHEITHHLQAASKAQYNYFRMLALRYQAQQTGKTIDELIAEKQNTYKNVGLTPSQVIDEIAADFAGELMQDGKLEDLLTRIENGELVTDVSKGRQIIQSFVDTVKSLIEKIKAKFSSGRYYDKAVELESVIKAYENAVVRAVRNKNNNIFSEKKFNLKDKLTSVDNSDIIIKKQRRYGTQIRFSTRGLRLTPHEHEKFFSSVNTNYNNKNKTHEGLQYQSCVFDDKHILYLYEDGGFNHYNVVARIDYENEDVAKMIMEDIDNGEIRNTSKGIARWIESPTIRQGGYSVYNVSTKRRRTAKRDDSIYNTVSQGVSRNSEDGTSIRTDGGSYSDSGRRNRGRGGQFLISEDGADIAERESHKLSDEWNEKIEEYGAIPKGEKAKRNIDVPNQISERKYVSRFARTMLEAGVTPDFAVSEFEKSILDGTMTHEVITDKAAAKSATEKIEKEGFSEALKSWEVLSKEGRVGKKDMALGMTLFNQCVTNKDITNAMKIAADLVAEASNAGQALQACRLLKLMTPDGNEVLKTDVDLVGAALREEGYLRLTILR